jgi:hypothetical protein
LESLRGALAAEAKVVSAEIDSLHRENRAAKAREQYAAKLSTLSFDKVGLIHSATLMILVIS